MALIAGLFAAGAWIALLLLPSRPWSTRERLDPHIPAHAADGIAAELGDVDVIVPARNEAGHIALTLAGLARQGRGLAAIVVDDQSTDGTADVASAAGADPDRLQVSVVAGQPLPAGWGGKLWALEQGFAATGREWVLLLDADIEIDPGVVAELRFRAINEGFSLVSVMADLRCESFWERLLVPPFVYFFKLIYPFRQVADPDSRTAAAAGGCVLVRAAVLRDAGAFASMRDALIDDCTLAGLVKRRGGRIWLGLSHAVRSHRRYDTFGVFARMITRTAFTQLRYSTALLLLVTALMAIVFAGPFLVIWNHPDTTGVLVGVSGIVAMLAAFVPIQRWYGLHPAWILSLPLASILYLGMTWASAIAYWCGVRARWKGRAYAVD